MNVTEGKAWHGGGRADEAKGPKGSQVMCLPILRRVARPRHPRRGGREGAGAGRGGWEDRGRMSEGKGREEDR